MVGQISKIISGPIRSQNTCKISDFQNIFFWKSTHVWPVCQFSWFTPVHWGTLKHKSILLFLSLYAVQCSKSTACTGNHTNWHWHCQGTVSLYLRNFYNEFKTRLKCMYKQNIFLDLVSKWLLEVCPTTKFPFVMLTIIKSNIKAYIFYFFYFLFLSK